MNGLIIKAIAGFFYVKTEEKIYQCKARGIFKKNGVIPYVGDQVEIEVTDIEDDEGIINKIMPRKNLFIRPPIANVDCFLVIMSLINPEPNLQILDKFLVMAEKAGTEIVICLNKTDLVDEEKVKEVKELYEGLYPIVCTSSAKMQGIEELKSFLPGKKSALAGPSGVGKSSIVNCIQRDLDAEIGAIGHKSKRGKHTTRHTELFTLNSGGMIYDTPGFTSFDILEAGEEELGYFYPEIARISGDCKYDNCRHLSEPGCKVVEALNNGEISNSRYHSYSSQMENIREKEKNKW